MVTTVFIELGIIIIIASAIAVVMSLLKQPLIIGYIITGIIVSPFFLSVIKSQDEIRTFAHLGVALLLFTVGLNLNIKVIKDIGKVSLLVGLGQVILTASLGFLIAQFFFTTLISIYLAIALAFSSTIVITKLLSDKGDLETLYGKIAIGILIIQDLIVVILLFVVSSVTNESSISNLIFSTLLKGAGLILTLFLVGYYLLPKITKLIAKSQELLLLFSIGWAFAIAALFGYLSFSVEVGALIAGVTLAFSPYRYEISAKMRPIRDFFLILFFVLLGTQIDFMGLSQYIVPIILLSAFVLIGKPLIILTLMGALGYKKRNSFLTGTSLAQISEFSIIFITLIAAVSIINSPFGIKDQTIPLISIVTVIALITIAGSSYMMTHAGKIYSLLSRYLKIFERKKGKKPDDHKFHQDETFPIILFGYNRIGYDILESIKKTKKKTLIVDYNPDTIDHLVKDGFDCVYGDAYDTELLNDLKLQNTKMIISTIPDLDTNLLLINKVRDCNKKAIIIVISHQIEETLRLYESGATYVIMPHFLGGHHIASMIEDYKLDLSKFLKKKTAHIKELRKKKRMKHEHPKHEKS